MTAARAATGALTLALAVALVLPAGAQVAGGVAALSGAGVLRVRGCGADREPRFATVVTLLADGTWAASDAAGERFGGSWTAAGPSGRAFELFFDAQTEADLVADVTRDVGLLCERPGAVVVTSSTRARFSLTLNRQRRKARLVLRYVFQGTAGDQSGTARYRIRAKGPFVPAA